MKHLNFTETQIEKLEYFSKKFNTNLLVKRDDLGFQEIGGGSKARMLMYILSDYADGNYDTIVTAGGPHSNFNRACALLCARLGIEMHLIAYTDIPSEYTDSFNYKLTVTTGTHITRCDRSNVANTIDSVISHLKSMGKRPKFIYAGGKCLGGYYAYYEAVRELYRQIQNIDHIFLACGTGTTLSGILVGAQQLFPNTKIHAISVARDWEAERPVLECDIAELNEYINATSDLSNLQFYDQFRCGGYAQFDSELLSTIRESISREGMIIDPTYSGKAFHAMTKIIDSPDFRNQNILFWNTGGLFNLMEVLSSDIQIPEISTF